MGSHLRVLIAMTAIQWVPTSHDLYGFQKSFYPCDLELSIRRVNLPHTEPPTFEYKDAYSVDQVKMTSSPSNRYECKLFTYLALWLAWP